MRSTTLASFLPLVFVVEGFVPSYHHSAISSTTARAVAAISEMTETQQDDITRQAPQHEQEATDDLHWFRFAGIGALYSDDKTQSDEDAVLERLQSATVAVVGLGGVGSWAVESLGRSGIGNIVLVDLDDLCISSTNRQLHAMSSNIGDLKSEVVQKRLKDISPGAKVTLINDFIMDDTAEEIVSQLKELQVQVVVDAIDGPEEKAALWLACAEHNIPIVACGNAAGRMDPLRMVCDEDPKGDISLEAAFRALAKKTDRKVHVPCIHIPADFEEQEAEVSSFRSDGALGTASFVSGSMGLAAASRVVEGIAKQTLKPPMAERR